VVITAGVERERRRKCPRSTILLGFACGGGAWERCAAIVPVFPEVLLYNSWIFRGLFCNFFTCWNMYLNYY